MKIVINKHYLKNCIPFFSKQEIFEYAGMVNFVRNIPRHVRTLQVENLF